MVLNPTPHEGGGEDSSRPQMVFFITSVRDATELQNLVIVLKFNGEYNFRYKNDTLSPESRDTTIFGKSPCQKVVNLHLYCHNF